jgi:FKBP-type peptidyl-prolyl cis-trans isomerase
MKRTLKINTIAFLSIIVLLISISSCLDEDAPRTYEQEMLELNELLLSIEADGVNIDTTALGVYYITHTEGEGPLAVEGDTVYIEYDGFLSDGSIFDSSKDWATEGIWEFVYGEQSLIDGFHEAISYMNKGAQMEFIIPSHLAYGAYGTGAIGSYQTLIFGVQLTDHKITNQ